MALLYHNYALLIFYIEAGGSRGKQGDGLLIVPMINIRRHQTG